MIEVKKVKTIRISDTLIKRVETYANKNSLTFTAAIIQLVVMSLDKEEK